MIGVALESAFNETKKRRKNVLLNIVIITDAYR